MGYGDILIHIDEDLEDERIHDLQRVLGNIRGVLSACVPDRRRHLMVVDFDPEGVRPSQLVQAVRSHGLRAEMLGL